MKGRRPTKSAAQKRLEGNRAKDVIHETIAVSGGLPTPPRELSKGARREWWRLVRAAPERLISRLDRNALADYCENQVLLSRLRTELEQESELTYPNEKTGTFLPRPQMRMIATIVAQQVRLGVELGFTPASRSRVHLPTPPAGDVHEGFLFGGVNDRAG